MNDVVAEISMPRQDVTLARGCSKGIQTVGVSPAALDDLIHELRQPLSTIDSLAYFLEITSADSNMRDHLQRIQAMVSRVHDILDRSSEIRAFTPSAV